MDCDITEKTSTLNSGLRLKTKHLQNLLHFAFENHTLTVNDMFTEFEEENYLLRYAPGQHLTQQEREEVFGDDQDMLEYVKIEEKSIIMG